MQELAVRSGARTLCMVDGEEQGLIVALDPRFLTLVGADAPSLAARVRERETTMSHLVDCVDATLFQSSSHATRWKDPVFDRVYQHLPADGNQQVSSLVKAPPEAGRYRIDVFAGLSEACGEGDPVCTLSLRSADGAPLLSASFAGRHFGRGKWAILSASFDGDGVSGPLRLALTNVGFAALRVQRIELWRW
ncbi:MAG: hypothetical protein U5J83_08200 [Bryobacterales bacterium]|nr:hypothetical protein [Bryobacterales bacterium]